MVMGEQKMNTRFLHPIKDIKKEIKYSIKHED